MSQLLIIYYQRRHHICQNVYTSRLLVRVPNLYFGSRLGAQYPKNSKIFLWRLPQPSFGDALVKVDKNWNISGLLSGFQLEKLFFIHTVRSYSHSTATAEFVICHRRICIFIRRLRSTAFLTFQHFQISPGQYLAFSWEIQLKKWEIHLISLSQSKLQIRRWQ